MHRVASPLCPDGEVASRRLWVLPRFSASLVGGGRKVRRIQLLRGWAFDRSRAKKTTPADLTFMCQSSAGSANTALRVLVRSSAASSAHLLLFDLPLIDVAVMFLFRPPSLCDLWRLWHLVANQPYSRLNTPSACALQLDSLLFGCRCRWVANRFHAKASHYQIFSPRGPDRHFVAQTCVMSNFTGGLLQQKPVLGCCTIVYFILGMIGFSKFPVIEFVIKLCVPASELAGAMCPLLTSDAVRYSRKKRISSFSTASGWKVELVDVGRGGVVSRCRRCNPSSSLLNRLHSLPSSTATGFNANHND